MNEMNGTWHDGGGDAGREPDPAAMGSTRRSWLAGAAGLFAAAVMPHRKAVGAQTTIDRGLPTSVWPYQTPGVRFLLEARVTIAPMIDIGDTSHGIRRIIPITGGAFTGPGLSGTVLDEGEDTQLVRLDGVHEITARYTLRTHDGILIYVINRGLIVPGAPATGARSTVHAGPRMPVYVRTVPQLEAPRESRYEWLNRALYVGTLNPLPPKEHAVVVRFFKVT